MSALAELTGALLGVRWARRRSRRRAGRGRAGRRQSVLSGRAMYRRDERGCYAGSSRRRR